jgi:hypothetical protein
VNDRSAFWAAILGGEDIKFWVTVCVASALKILFTRGKQTIRDAFGSVLAGAALAYYGHDWVITYFDALTPKDENLVVIGLVFTGEHVVRWMLDQGPGMIRRRLGLLEVAEATNKAAEAARTNGETK